MFVTLRYPVFVMFVRQRSAEGWGIGCRGHPVSADSDTEVIQCLGCWGYPVFVLFGKCGSSSVYVCETQVTRTVTILTRSYISMIYVKRRERRRKKKKKKKTRQHFWNVHRCCCFCFPYLLHTGYPVVSMLTFSGFLADAAKNDVQIPPPPSPVRLLSTAPLTFPPVSLLCVLDDLGEREPAAELAVRASQVLLLSAVDGRMLQLCTCVSS